MNATNVFARNSDRKDSQQIKPPSSAAAAVTSEATELISPMYSLQQLICWIVSNLGLVFNTHLHILITVAFECINKEDISNIAMEADLTQHAETN